MNQNLVLAPTPNAGLRGVTAPVADPSVRRALRRTSPTTIPAGTAGHQNGCTTMNLMPEELARAQMSARLGEAQARRRGSRLVAAQRLSRKAERAAAAARLALARAL